ncbi:hypothetical protein HJFPF1_10698 [Paramyrothecium foliicola]|nr:hypothetical protein HJFPF1_10698 [Paramyrothecium foliicola]
MDEHTPKEKTKARKSGSSLLSKVTQLGLGANIFVAAVYWEPTHHCHRVAVYLPPDHEFPDVDGLIRDALPDRPPSPGAWRRHRLPTRYDYDDKEKAKARKSGPSLLNKTIELGESARIFAATIYWEPTHRLYEVAAYLPDGEFVPSVHNLVSHGSFFWAKDPFVPEAHFATHYCRPSESQWQSFKHIQSKYSHLTAFLYPGDRPVTEEQPVDSAVDVNSTPLDMGEDEAQHMGFSEQLNSEPCDLRSPERLIYPDRSEATLEALVNAPLMNPDTALPTTEKTMPAETFPSETSGVETSLADTPPMGTPMVDYVQNQTYPVISINRIDVQVMARRDSTPCKPFAMLCTDFTFEPILESCPSLIPHIVEHSLENCSGDDPIDAESEYWLDLLTPDSDKTIVEPADFGHNLAHVNVTKENSVSQGGKTSEQTSTRILESLREARKMLEETLQISAARSGESSAAFVTSPIQSASSRKRKHIGDNSDRAFCTNSPKMRRSVSVSCTPRVEEVFITPIRAIAFVDNCALEFVWKARRGSQGWVDCTDAGQNKWHDGCGLLMYGSDLEVEVRCNGEWQPLSLRWCESRDVFRGFDEIENRILEVSSPEMLKLMEGKSGCVGRVY